MTAVVVVLRARLGQFPVALALLPTGRLRELLLVKPTLVIMLDRPSARCTEYRACVLHPPSGDVCNGL